MDFYHRQPCHYEKRQLALIFASNTIKGGAIFEFRDSEKCVKDSIYLRRNDPRSVRLKRRRPAMSCSAHAQVDAGSWGLAGGCLLNGCREPVRHIDYE